MSKLDYSLITDVEVSGIDMSDYPDFCDAFIESASYQGRPLTEAELEELNNDSSFVYETVIEKVF